MIQAVGAALSIRWLHIGEVVVGEFCTTQGAVSIDYFKILHLLNQMQVPFNN
jgi:hypothetical protein